ncbi:hypothetical protein PWT90_04765 [Aphanocladium album]|nr:hypothetical protein PWT90_04765 [Aphanocladium album]
MGSASSKAAKSASRKFPARSAGSAVSQTTRPRAAQASEPAIAAKDQTIVEDAADPDFTPAGFASRLQQMGIVDPNPTYSPSSRAAGAHQLGGMPSSAAGPIFPSSRANATLSALESRRQVQQRADEDMEHFQQVGIRAARRRYVDMRTLSDALQLLDKGVPPREVEGKMGMQEGLLDKLGRKGILTHLLGGAASGGARGPDSGFYNIPSIGLFDASWHTWQQRKISPTSDMTLWASPLSGPNDGSSGPPEQEQAALAAGNVRRVKCDEERPKCRSCARRKTMCHYELTPAGTTSQNSFTNQHPTSPHDGTEEPHNLDRWQANRHSSLDALLETWASDDESPAEQQQKRWQLQQVLTAQPGPWYAEFPGMRSVPVWLIPPGWEAIEAAEWRNLFINKQAAEVDLAETYESPGSSVYE